VRVHPERQIVAAIVACVTAGFSTPGVRVQLADALWLLDASSGLSRTTAAVTISTSTSSVCGRGRGTTDIKVGGPFAAHKMAGTAIAGRGLVSVGPPRMLPAAAIVGAMSRRVVRMLVALGALLTLSGFAPSLARGAIAFTPCRANSPVLCGTVAAPLDFSGATPGQINLHVEKLPAQGLAKGVLFLIAGGPGQGSAQVFDLADAGSSYQSIFPGYTLVTYDDRGTGQSGPLSCPGIDSLFSASSAQGTALVAACGNSIGVSRVFYSTRDHASDIEVIRQALGVDRIALWGTSYGTKLAMAYALAYPGHVERLLLDSVLPPTGPDPFGVDTIKAMPNGINDLCFGGACKTVTKNAFADVATLANRLEQKPLTGTVKLHPGSPPVSIRIDGNNLLSNVVLDSDLVPGIGTELPAAVKAALEGKPKLLLRLYALDTVSAGISESSGFDTALYVATSCDDGPFPWTASTPLGDRQAAIDAALNALPAGSLGPFGNWAVGLGNAQMCRDWPAAGNTPLATGPLPNVPVLVLSGGRDMRTPTADGRQVASLFPQGHVLVLPGWGHSVLGNSTCVDNAVTGWLSGETPPSSCPRVPPIVKPLGRFPSSVAEAGFVGSVRGLPGHTLAAVVRTLEEAESSWLLSSSEPTAGLVGGSLRAATGAFRLSSYSDVPGLTVSGTVKQKSIGVFPLDFEGTLTIAGPKASHGGLELFGNALSGTLDGKRVRVTF
jgi:pimeloyl-ACP methyl ester carboxylesterase